MPDITRIFELLDIYRLPPHGNDTVFTYKPDSEYIHISGADYLEKVDGLAKGLLEAGIKKGDTIATIIGNRPEWNYFDMAMLSIGAIQVPVYATSGYDTCSFIFQDANISMLILENEDTVRRMKRMLLHLDEHIKVFTIEKIKGFHHWSSLLATKDSSTSKYDLDNIRANISEYEIASIIYTSGTTGDPKGVMLSHKNFVSNFQAVSELMRLDLVSNALSFLPLCHVYERMLNYMYQHLGIIILYGGGIKKIKDDLLDLKPDMICVVPRIMEKLYVRMTTKGHELPLIKRFLYFWALNVAGHYKIDRRNHLLYRIRFRVADRLVYGRIRKSMGGKLKVIISGGAALNPKLFRIFKAMGYFVLTGYGLTETSPVIAVTSFDDEKLREGTVGPVIRDMEIQIAPDNEILVKGPNVMLGYYNNPKLTAEVLDENGWFRTGDTGEMVEGIYLKIKERKNEIFKTSGGKYVAPQVMENKIRESSFIENIMIFGENRKFPAAIVAPNFEQLTSWAKYKQIAFENNNDLIHNPIVLARIARDIEELSEGFDHSAKIKKFFLAPKPWTPESGFLTPTMKLKRKVIEKKYKKPIEKLYRD